MAALPERGRLDEHPLPHVVLGLYQTSFTGALVLTRERIEKRVHFVDGTVTFAESNLASESLGVQLLDGGRISREDYSRVVGLVALKKCKEGKALLDLRLLGPKELFLALKEQVRRRVVECFAWPSGEFAVSAGDEGPGGAQAFRTDPIALLQSGLAGHWSADRVLAAIGGGLGRYPRPGRRFARIQRRLIADDSVNALLQSLDGSRALGEIVMASPTPTALAAAWILDATGALDYADAPAASEAEGDDPAEERDLEIEIVVDGGGPAPAPKPARARSASPGTAAGGARRADADSEALRRRILDTHARLFELDHYQLLDAARDATPNDIKRSYFRLAKRYHPDALAAAGLASVRREANEVFARISRAHAVLADPSKRREYDRSLEGGGGQDQASRVANAEVLYRKAEVLLRKGDFKGALGFLQPAVDLWPEDTAYQGALGWALFKKPRPDVETARRHLEKAVELDAANALALFRLGTVLRAAGDAQAGARCIDRARSLDPKVDRRT